MEENFRTKSAMLIGFLVIIWGLCWPIFKATLAFTPPILFAGMRSLIGGVFLALLIIPRWRLIQWHKTWQIYLISALFNGVLFYGIQNIGLEFMPSGLFSVIVYLQPVLVGIFAWLWLGEHLSIVKIGGLLIGFMGVGAVSMDGFTNNTSLTGIGLALVTGVSWALGTVYVKKIGHKVDYMWLVSLQYTIAGIVLTAAGLNVEKWSSIVWNGIYLFGLLFGSLFGIAAAWVVYFWLVGSGEVSKVTSYTFLVPLISVLIGTLFLKEPFTIHLLLGLILIVASIYLVNRKPKEDTIQPLSQKTC